MLKIHEMRGPTSSADDAAGDRRLDVGDGVGEGEGHLLDGGRAGVADVVAADADGVELRQLLGAVGHEVGGETERRLRRVDVGAAGDVLLEDVVLRGAGDLVLRDALLLADDGVHRDEHGRRGVDGHRGADLVERDAVEHRLHVGERVDGDADLADLALGERVVGVVAELRREVEGDGEAGLALAQEELEALVGLLGGAVAGVLADRPEAAAVHVGLDAAGEGVLAGIADVTVVVVAVGVRRACTAG